MPDVCAAFKIDHSVLLDRLIMWVGLSGTVHSWYRLFLEGRGYVVSIGDHKSKQISMIFGIPQGSVLGSLLVNLYMLPPGSGHTQ